MNLRASHRVDTPGWPPLYCLRESDALSAGAERAPLVSTVLILVRNADGGEEWTPWRAVP